MAGWQRASVVHRPCRCRVQDRRCGRALTNALPRGLATLRAFVLDQKLLGNVGRAAHPGLLSFGPLSLGSPVCVTGECPTGGGDGAAALTAGGCDRIIANRK
jgi:hypothetical protein